MGVESSSSVSLLPAALLVLDDVFPGASDCCTCPARPLLEDGGLGERDDSSRARAWASGIGVLESSISNCISQVRRSCFV